jgi:hypothetical protein
VLIQLRDRLKPDDPHQGVLSDLEHRAYAREATRENPAMALPIAAGIPVYQLMKALGVMKARTPPRMDQMLGGYTGILEGLSGQRP